MVVQYFGQIEATNNKNKEVKNGIQKTALQTEKQKKFPERRPYTKKEFFRSDNAGRIQTLKIYGTIRTTRKAPHLRGLFHKGKKWLAIIR